MTIYDFRTQLQNVTTSNLDNMFFSLHFSLVSLFNKLLIGFFQSLGAKYYFF